LSTPIARQTKPAPETSPNEVARGGELRRIAQEARSANGRIKIPIVSALTNENASRAPTPAHAANHAQTALAVISDSL
jgi:hypothetical protein